ncbi:hypothetical protein EOM09_08510 [bacterium]|nr:hypothetical protein [bacterium]
MGKLNILYGNIFDYLEGMDAIVNSNNQYMIYGSGICGQIYKRAGKEKLEEYCKTNFKDNMKINEVRITPGFDLGIDIIHIYCPKAYESKEPLKELLESYENIFKIAKEKDYKNVICPSLGTGIHGYKEKEIIDEVLEKLKSLIKNTKINFNLIIFRKE